MTASFTAEEMIEITEGRLAVGLMPDDPGELCTDTRLLKQGQWFIALAGTNFDGHDFLGDAFSAGALGCLVEERGGYPIAESQFPLIAVNNTWRAYHQLALVDWRCRFNANVLVVASAGQESKAIFDQCVTASEARCLGQTLVCREANAASVLPLLLNMNEDTAAILVDYRPRTTVEVHELVQIIQPRIAIITSESFAHLRLEFAQDAIDAALLSLTHSVNEETGLVIVDKASQSHLHLSKDELSLTIVVSDFARQTFLSTIEQLLSRS